MQEVPPTREPFAWILAINHAVEGGEILDVVALAAAGAAELARIGERVLHALGRCRMAREEIDAARRGAIACLEIRVALHVGQEARRAVGIETGACRDSHANAVGLELLRAREGGERQL